MDQVRGLACIRSGKIWAWQRERERELVNGSQWESNGWGLICQRDLFLFLLSLSLPFLPYPIRVLLFLLVSADYSKEEIWVHNRTSQTLLETVLFFPDKNGIRSDGGGRRSGTTKVRTELLNNPTSCCQCHLDLRSTLLHTTEHQDLLFLCIHAWI